jgi:hypothetical protein
VVEGDFHSFEGADAVGSSGYHSDVVVLTFDGSTGNFAFSPETVQQQRFMSAQHPDHRFHGLQVAAQGSEAPIPKDSTAGEMTNDDIPLGHALDANRQRNGNQRRQTFGYD